MGSGVDRPLKPRDRFQRSMAQICPLRPMLQNFLAQQQRQITQQKARSRIGFMYIPKLDEAIATILKRPVEVCRNGLAPKRPDGATPAIRRALGTTRAFGPWP
jgi:hypothetical protein